MRVEGRGSREARHGERLRHYLDQGKEVLFVCGAAHWKSIRAYLDCGRRDLPLGEEQRRPQRLVLATLEPAVA